MKHPELYLRELRIISNLIDSYEERRVWKVPRSLAKKILEEHADQRAHLPTPPLQEERGMNAPLSTHERGQLTLTDFLKVGGVSHV